jgi:hypothetical protein
MNIDMLELISAMGLTGAGSVLAARYLGSKLLDHRLAKDLKDYDAEVSQRLALHKADIERELSQAKAATDARLKKEVEEYLGERTVERTYRAEAQKRLYLAVGPLRFQLILAAAEFANRIARISRGDTYDMAINSHFGQSTAYRLLRILAIAELVERHIAYADFSVDASMQSLLRFKRDTLGCLSSDRVSLAHPHEDWARQAQHVFYDVLTTIASALILPQEKEGSRVMRFDEFATKMSDAEWKTLIHPIPRLIGGFRPDSKPIFWLRLLAVAQCCIGLLEAQGSELGVEIDTTELDRALSATGDAHIQANRDQYLEMLSRYRIHQHGKATVPGSRT